MVEVAAPYLLPFLGLMLWALHVALVVSAAGPRTARWAARWGSLAGLPVACVATWVLWAKYAPERQPRGVWDVSAGNVLMLANVLLGLFVWLWLLALEPLVQHLGRRQERRRQERDGRALPAGRPSAASRH